MSLPIARPPVLLPTRKTLRHLCRHTGAVRSAVIATLTSLLGAMFAAASPQDTLVVHFAAELRTGPPVATGGSVPGLVEKEEWRILPAT